MSARNDKREFAKNMAAEAERAASWGDILTVYMLSNVQRNPFHCIEDKSGQLHTNQVDGQNFGVNISRMFCTSRCPISHSSVPDVPLFDLDIYSGPILFQEVPPELLKYRKKNSCWPSI